MQTIPLKIVDQADASGARVMAVRNFLVSVVKLPRLEIAFGKKFRQVA